MSANVQLEKASHGTAVSKNRLANEVLDSLPNPVVMISGEDVPIYANFAAESFFQASEALLCRTGLAELFPFGSPIFALVEQVRQSRTMVSEYKLDISSPRIGQDKLVDVYASPSATRAIRNVRSFSASRTALDQLANACSI